MNVRLRLLRESGALYGTVDDIRLNSLGPLRHVADFVSNFFPTLAGTTFRGTLVVETTSTYGDIVATALTVKEGMLSALPVIPVVSAGGGSGGGGSSTGGGSVKLYFITSFLGGSNVQFQGQTLIQDKGYAFDGLAPGTYEISGTVLELQRISRYRRRRSRIDSDHFRSLSCDRRL